MCQQSIQTSCPHIPLCWYQLYSMGLMCSQHLQVFDEMRLCANLYCDCILFWITKLLWSLYGYMYMQANVYWVCVGVFVCIVYVWWSPLRDVSGYRIVGCPKCIDDNKYQRNAFIFNSVFVFDSTTDISPYEPVIQKLGDAFKTYEVEWHSGILELQCTGMQQWWVRDQSIVVVWTHS